MTTKNRITREMVLIAAGAVVAILLLFLLYHQFGAWKAARETAGSERAELERARAQLQNLKLLKEQAEIMEEKLVLLEKAMPAVPAEEHLIEHLQSCAGESGVELLQFRFGERVDKGGYSEMPVNISFEGSYHNIVYLLDRIQNGSRMVRIDEVKLGKVSKDNPYLRVDVFACAFYSPR